MSDFWSRRRAAVKAEEHHLTVKADQSRREAQEADFAERSDADLLHELDLPAPEGVDSAELLQKFMRSALPRRLKQRALRQFWTRKPVLACLDGLVDYADDYTDAATCVPDLQTTYQVGKGLMAHVEALARAEDAKAMPSSTDAMIDPETAPNDEADVSAERQPADETEREAVEVPEDVVQDEATVKTARRMRFRFEEAV